MGIHRYRCAYSAPSPFVPGRGYVGPRVSDGAYLIVRADCILMNGRTFSRDDAEAICAALDEAVEVGIDECVEV